MASSASHEPLRVDRRDLVMKVHLDVSARVAATGVPELAQELLARIGHKLAGGSAELVKITYPKQDSDGRG